MGAVFVVAEIRAVIVISSDLSSCVSVCQCEGLHSVPAVSKIISQKRSVVCVQHPDGDT